MSSTASQSAEPTARRASSATLRRTVGLGALAMTLLLGACGSDQELGGKVVKDGLGCTVSEVDRTTDEVTVPTDVKVGKKTKTTDVEEGGKGACTAASGQYLTLDLVGATASDGKVFNDTYGEDRALTVRLGENQLIPGLETGLAGMKVGSRRQIVVPAAEAYGKDGNPAQGIGPDADLVFVVDLVSLTDTPTYCNEATSIPKGTREGKPTEVKMPVKAPVDEVKTTVLEEGDGPKATTKSYLTVDYLGVSCGNGQQFDSSWDREDPITIALKDAEATDTAFQVIPGWSDGLVGQKQGSTVQIDIPFDDAYGTEGRPPSIGPSDPLTFIVKIIEVAEEAPPSTTTTTAAPAATTTTAAGK